jgi:hypothetical protein
MQKITVNNVVDRIECGTGFDDGRIAGSVVSSKLCGSGTVTMLYKQ